MTIEKLDQKIFSNTLNTCHYIKGYINSNSIITLHCEIHNYDFETKYENVSRDNRKHHVCPICQQEDRDLKNSDKWTEVICAYCNQKFKKRISKLEDSKSGLYFCCREHKDLAQRIDSGQDFNDMRPDHYGSIVSGSSYRKIAFRNYPHKCAICGWNEDEDILQVHHIDENRSNAKLENLIILCPTCHQKLTIGKYELIGREKIVLKQEK